MKVCQRWPLPGPTSPDNSAPIQLVKLEKKSKSKIDINSIIGVGTGSTVNYFIEELAKIKHTFKGAVSSSDASTQLLEKLGVEVFELNDVNEILV